jgi:hypothetical protein
MEKLRPHRHTLLTSGLVLLFAAGHAHPQDGDDDVLDWMQTLDAPAAALSDYQWTLAYGSSLLLTPIDGYLYPARWSDGKLLESQPPQIKVELYREQTQATVAVSDLVSPRSLTPAEWVMEVRTGSTWNPVSHFVFDQQFFFARSTPGTLDLVSTDAIRFKAIAE